MKKSKLTLAEGSDELEQERIRKLRKLLEGLPEGSRGELLWYLKRQLATGKPPPDDQLSPALRSAR